MQSFQSESSTQIFHVSQVDHVTSEHRYRMWHRQPKCYPVTQVATSWCIFFFIPFIGGNPYPNIPPTEIYQYIIEGNRMERPVDCPEEMYVLWTQFVSCCRLFSSCAKSSTRPLPAFPYPGFHLKWRSSAKLAISCCLVLNLELESNKWSVLLLKFTYSD